MGANRQKVNSVNLRKLCWLRGYEGVTGLARSINRSRVTLHRAVKNPDQFGPTYKLVIAALSGQ